MDSKPFTRRSPVWKFVHRKKKANLKQFEQQVGSLHRHYAAFLFK